MAIRSLKDLEGHAIRATDGEMGRVESFLLDDRDWRVRYMVLQAGGWLSGHLVLISPDAMSAPLGDEAEVAVNLSKAQVESAPSIDSDPPVSRQGALVGTASDPWPTYWAGPMDWGFPGPWLVTPAPAAPIAPQGPVVSEDADPHLRSARELTGYHISATDGEIGHVDDLLADVHGWRVTHFVVDTRNWLPAKKVRVAIDWIGEISFAERTVQVKRSRAEVEEGGLA